MTYFIKAALLFGCCVTFSLGTVAQQDTEALYVQVRDQGTECGRGIDRSAEALACQAACENPTTNLRVLLGAVPQPIPAEIMAEVDACNASYDVFDAARTVSEAAEQDVAVANEPSALPTPSDTSSPYAALTVELTGFLNVCEDLTRKTRHQAACVKFCPLAISDLERLEQGDAELVQQLSIARGDASRLPNARQCRRFHGFATR